ncbi:MAG: hypothetical protein IJ111_05525 [Eggerthellaceae bacterium]|nr:hypothetical protein [Eggerthellaceae bacterium]
MMSKMEGKAEPVGSVDEFATFFDSGAPWPMATGAGTGDSAGGDGACLVLEGAMTCGNGECFRVYSYQGTLLARSVLYFAKELGNDYDDVPVDEMWVELDGRLPMANAIAHGYSKVGLISPGERSYEATLLVSGAKAAWFELRKTRVGIRFDFNSKTVTVQEFDGKFPECSNGESCEWIYFEDAEGNLYETNRTYDTFARIWDDGVLTAMEWVDREEKSDFMEALKSVDDADRVRGSVSFHRDADDLAEEELRFYAKGPDGRVREYQGLIKFQSPCTGNYVFVYTNAPNRRRGGLKVYASEYDPLQWRALGGLGSGRLDLGELIDPRDWNEVSRIIGNGYEVSTLNASAIDSTHVALPRKSLGLIDKVRFAMGL